VIDEMKGSIHDLYSKSLRAVVHGYLASTPVELTMLNVVRSCAGHAPGVTFFRLPPNEIRFVRPNMPLMGNRR
jgi:hypothetical protein